RWQRAGSVDNGGVPWFVIEEILSGVPGAESGDVALAGEGLYPFAKAPGAEGGGIAVMVVGHGQGLFDIRGCEHRLILSDRQPARDPQDSGVDQRQAAEPLDQ